MSADPIGRHVPGSGRGRQRAPSSRAGGRRWWLREGATHRLLRIPGSGRRLPAAWLIFSGSLLVAAPLVAQEASKPPRASGQIEEIVVTAEKRETAIQDTSAAISAFTGADLDAAGIDDVEGLSFVVPNLHFGKAADGPDTFITIRGISTSGGDQAVAFHVDGIYQNQSRSAGLTFYDIQRVEVLRGPQGTLYGRNATGGVINVISNIPVDELQAFGDVQFGTYSQIVTRAVLNVPLLEERLLSRVSFLRETRDGYQKNQFTSVRSRDAQDADDTSVRAQLRFVPSEDVDFILRGSYTHLGGVGSGAKVIKPFPDLVDIGVLPVPFDIYNVCSPTNPPPCTTQNPSDPRRIYQDFIPDQDLDSYAASGTLTWDLADLPWVGDAQLAAIGSWQRTDGSFALDADYSDSFLVTAFTDFPKTRQYTAELRLASASGGPLEWLAGLFYLNETDAADTDARSGLFRVITGQNVELSAPRASTSDSESFAAFGNASYRLGEGTATIWDDLRLIGGLRYTYDKKKETREAPLAKIFSLDNPFPPGLEPAVCTSPDGVCPVDVEDSDSWGELSGEAGIEWAWSLDNMAYLKVARGYKAGAIELGPPPGFPPGPLIGGPTRDNPDPEKLWAYEIGSKNRFLENRIQANFTAFYYDYDDLQIAQLIDDQEITENAAKATIWGAEAEFVALPLEALQLTANFSYLSAEFDEFISNDAANPVSLDPTAPNYDPGAFDCGRLDPCLDFGGNTMIRAPEYSMTLVAQYTWELGRWGTLVPRVQFYASDDVWYRPYNEPSTDKIGNYSKTDVRLTWVSEEGHLSVEGFVDNLFDEDVPQSVFLGSSLLGFPVQAVYDPPRTTGVRIGLRW